jgi:hypothetical protein
MKMADMLVLQQIRKNSNVPDAVWQEIEVAVMEKGILGLTGTAKAIVESEVRKHASHDQSSHGRGRGGGGAKGDSKGSSNENAGEANAASAGKPLKAPKKGMLNSGTANAIVAASARNGGEKITVTQALQSNDVVRRMGADVVTVAPSAGLPPKSKARIVGYRPTDRNRVFVQFSENVTINGATSRFHEMKVSGKEGGQDPEVSPLL